MQRTTSRHKTTTKNTIQPQRRHSATTKKHNTIKKRHKTTTENAKQPQHDTKHDVKHKETGMGSRWESTRLWSLFIWIYLSDVLVCLFFSGSLFFYICLFCFSPTHTFVTAQLHLKTKKKSIKYLGFIFWGPNISEQSFMLISPVVGSIRSNPAGFPSSYFKHKRSSGLRWAAQTTQDLTCEALSESSSLQYPAAAAVSC